MLNGPRPSDSVKVQNRDGASPFVLSCDHASNFVPPDYGTLGLDPFELTRHIAWDPGALPVASRMADALDATLVQSCISRLVIDCNRPLDAPDLFRTVSETTAIPGNQAIDRCRRAPRRIALAYTPFHEAIDTVVATSAWREARKRGWCRSIPSRRSTRGRAALADRHHP